MGLFNSRACAVQFAYNEEQNLLRRAVDRFVETRYARAQRKQLRAEPRAYSQENWQTLADLGLLGLAFGVDEGGLGGGARELTAVMEALGNGMVIEPMLEEVIIGGRMLALLGSAAHRLEWMPRIMAGEAHVALAHFEHTARFNLSDVRVRAQSRAGSWTLGGEKSVVPWAAGANLWIVSAREQGDVDDPDGVGFFLVDPAADGIERRDFRLADGSPASSIRFRGTTAVRLPGSFERFSHGVDFARLAAGAEMVGVMSTLFDSTVEYLRTRKQFGAPLASFQALQHKLASLYVQLEQSRSHVARAALFLDSDVDAHSSVAGMKSYVGRTAIELGEACIHLHGGIGMSDELALGYGFKRLLVLAHLFGDPDAELSRFTGLRGGSRDAKARRPAQARA
jgi:alkylation response protein AidB-like acyl-CoA dehydrogenase